MNFNEIKKRRTFAIISHPDAGKTTLTEKFLLYGGAINLAGSVKGKKTAKYAVSDWMEIEKERGISVTSSVMQFNYEGYCINILDTPGHQDFSEDTYRTLMAADSAVMVIDASKGIFVPRGVANGFQVLSDTVSYSYLVNDYWALELKPKYAFVNYADPALGIQWENLEAAEVSEADKNHPLLKDVKPLRKEDL